MTPVTVANTSYILPPSPVSVQRLSPLRGASKTRGRNLSLVNVGRSPEGGEQEKWATQP